MLNLLKIIFKKADVGKKEHLSDEYLDVIRKFGELGIKIKECKELSIETWNQIYLTIESLYKKYSEIPIGYIKEINLSKNDGIAEAHLFCDKQYIYDTKQGICLSLNKNYFMDFALFGIKRKTTNFNVNDNEIIPFIIAHEFGHVIDIYHSLKDPCYQNKRFLSGDDLIILLETLPYSKKILEEALRNAYPELKRMNYEGFLSETISSNASQDFGEAFAEIIALNFLNKENRLIKEVETLIKCRGK